jgi:glycosyltransferase involved in cell wall biosynthesis
LVVYTGRINERKGLNTVLSLASRIPEAIFVLVGSQQTGTIETLAAELPNVIVRPWQPFRTTIEYMYAADILIIPPTLEPLQQFGTTVLPMKLFLYLASGRAIMAPRSPDTAELLVHERNAVLVPADSLDAQVTELRELLARPERQQRVIDGALQDALELTWDTRARRLKAYLEQRLSLSPQTLPNGQWNAANWVKRSARWAWTKVVSSEFS